MKRVMTAINKGRCLLLCGSRVESDPGAREALGQRTALPILTLGDTPVGPEHLAALAKGGGLLVLVEPDPGLDGRALEALAKALKKAKAKPDVLLVAPTYNPFGLPVGIRLMRIEHHKAQARDFLAELPVDGQVSPQAAAPLEAAAKKKSSKGSGAPHMALVGREEEKEALSAALLAGGPILLQGGEGVGRSWLASEVIEAQDSLNVEAEFTLRRDAGFDALAALIAISCGDEDLQKALQDKGTAGTPAETVDALVGALSRDESKGKVLIIRGLEPLLFRDGGLARQDRLGLLLQAVFTRPGQKASLLFISTAAPRIQGSAEALQVVNVGGLKGRELHEIFVAYHAEQAPRDKMGEVHNQTGGHPMAARAYAVSWRDSDNPEKLFDNKKFLKLVQPENVEVLQRHLQRKAEKLAAPLKQALFTIAHSPVGLTGQELSSLGINRDQRVTLTRLGLVDTTLHGDPRRYTVHPVLLSVLPYREINDFQTLETVARLVAKRFESLSGAAQMALGFEVNRMLVMARRDRSRRELAYADREPMLNSVLGLIRGKQPRAEMALQRVNHLLKLSPDNPELYAAKAEVMVAQNAEPQQIDELLHGAQERCPTPELFHFEAGWRLKRRRKGDQNRAVEALVRGRQAFPTESSLARRLGAVLAELQRWAEAEKALRESIEIDPSQPEAYSRLGEVLAAQGVERFGDAANALRYALELEPGRDTHQRRLANLLRLQAQAQPEQAAALIAEAKELLEAALKDAGKGQGFYGYMELAELILDTDGDAERAAWAAKKAEKLAKRKSPELAILIARVDTRMGRLDQAEGRLGRVLSGTTHHAEARAARGELLFARGKVFAAHQELTQALALAGEGSALRPRLQAQSEKLAALIASGEATEIEKAAEAAAAQASREATLAKVEEKLNSDRGNTVVRRKGHPEAPASQAAPGAGEALPHLHGATPTEAAAEKSEAAAEAPAEKSEAPAEPSDDPVTSPEG